MDPESGVGGEEPLRRTAYRTQANALFRKNLTFQKRNSKTNCCLIGFPLVLCVLLVVIQAAINHLLSGSDFECGCKCVPNANGGGCTKTCGIQYSDSNQAGYCAVPETEGWPAILQVPEPQFIAVKTTTSPELQDPACRATGTCAMTIFYTGSNRTTSDTMANYLLSTAAIDYTNPINSLATVVPGTSTIPSTTMLIESAFTSDTPVDLLRPICSGQSNSNITLDVTGGYTLTSDLQCVQTNTVWKPDASSVNNEIYAGYRDGNSDKAINEIPAAYDFGATSKTSLDLSVWYNGTYNNQSSYNPPNIIRVARSLNMATEAFLRFLAGPTAQLPLLFIKDMPKAASKLRLDFSSLLGPLFYMWILGFLFPVVLTALVYEKQYHLRMMMKMHGLGDRPYWSITYLYFLALFTIYMFCFILFGSLVGLKFFQLNSYSLQVVFYFLYINMIISLGFLVSARFRNVRTATVVGYLYVFGTGLMGSFFFEPFVIDRGTSRKLVLALEIIPAFATYRGLFEFAQYAFRAVYTGEKGMQWSNLNDENNGLKDVLVILFVEWVVFMILTFYLDQVAVTQSGINKHPLFFLNFKRKANKTVGGKAMGSRQPSARSKSLGQINVENGGGIGDRQDVAQERELVEELRTNPSKAYSIVCDDLRRVYPARDGNPPKVAVKGFSLAVPRGECMGILGPNGAGKTSSINMMIGFLKPTGGTAYIQGMNIQTDMDSIYSCMGVCPQHDLLWGQLTGREHLLFYGRLKNLKGPELTTAVETSLKSVNLFDGGVADKQCQKYSGGMKRRLSVAISLIGNPQVVYMDEPSTGLDPASRYNLWNVVKESKQNRAIILTTHSMEEAEALCDRLGIFVNGELQCIGNAKELTARYGGLYMLTITTPANEEAEVRALANSLTPNAKIVYSLSGTQKFELPKSEVSPAAVFTAVERAKQHLHVQAWGLSDTTLEDVFIKVARQAGGDQKLS